MVTEATEAADEDDDVFKSAFAHWLALRVPLRAVTAAKPHRADHDGYHSPAGRHRHKCAACGVVWEHKAREFARRADHTCPACGHGEPDEFDGLCERWHKYSGPDPPAYHDPGGAADANEETPA